MQISKRKQIVAGVATLGVLSASVISAQAEEVNRRVEKIPFQTKTQEDPTLPKGERKVIQKGVEGEKEIITTQSSTSSSTRKPVDVIVPYDVSGSTSGGEAELDHLEAVAKQGADDTRYMIIGYDEGNSEDGFMTATNGKTEGGGSYRKGAKLSKITKMLSKQEVLNFVAKVRELKPQSQQDGSWPWDKAMKALNLYNPTYMDASGEPKQAGLTYESLFDSVRDQNKAVGILWFTDEWEPTENLDTSFFEWAQKNHKDHFLTVVYGGPNAKSYKTLTAAGQKEVLTTSGKDSTALAKEIADKFTNLVTITTPGKATTTEKVIKEPVDEIIAIGTQEAAQTDRKVIKIPFKTVEEEDENLNEGVRKVVRPGVEGEKEFITTTIPGTKPQPGQGSGTITVTTKASTSTKTETKGRSIFMPVDGSGSTGFGTRKNILEDLDAIIKSLSDKDQIQLAFYEDNNANSYTSYGNTEKSSPTTIMMTKAQAVKLIDYVQAHQTGYAWVDAVNALGLRDKNAPAGKPYEQIFEESRDKSLTPVIIQLTDGWTTEEDIDHSFAKWAKENAKTFMSIVYDTQASTANKKMIEAGHPNIFLAVPKGKELTADERKAGILKQIAATTTETVTKGEDQTIRVTLGGNGVTVTKATIKGGSLNKDLPIKDGKVDYSEKLPGRGSPC